MSNAAAFPRDDRSWSPGALPFSVVCVAGSVAGLATSLASADSLGRLVALLATFLVLAALQGVVFVWAQRPWLQGGSVSGWVGPLQVSVFVLAFAFFGGGAAMGGAALCGLFGALFTANAWCIRRARANRAAVDAAEARLIQERAATRAAYDERASRLGPTLRTGRPAPAVGAVLRETLAELRSRLVAWTTALAVSVPGFLAANAEGSAVFVMILGLATVLWVSRLLVGVWLALRDFEKAATPPRRAYVVLLHDPSRKMMRPLLGVWSDEPLPTEGRLPRPEAVYRCDEDRDALLSFRRHAVVHEAWVDTGRWSRSRPRWVAADRGIAIPHRRSLLGRWYLRSLIGTERPAAAALLTSALPHPATEPTALVTEADPPAGAWLRLFGWRLAGLVVVGLLFMLL